MSINWDEINRIVKMYGLLTVAERVLDNLNELYDDHSLLKYKSMIVRDEKYKQNTIWDLEMGFIQKMFDLETRREKIRSVQKRKAFSKTKNRYPIYKNFNLNKMWKLETIHNVTIKYQVTYEDSKLKLFVLVDRKIVLDINGFLFQLIVYNDNLDNPYLYSLLEITFEDEPIGHVINTPILRDSNVLRKRSRGIKKECLYKEVETGALLETSVEFEEMGLKQGKNSCNFAISFNWFKYMQPLTYHHMEPNADSLYASKVLKFA